MRTPIKTWQDKRYYHKAHEASKENLKHPALKELSKIAKNARKVIELGCGEGTKLALLVPEGRKRVGVDISQEAILQAQKRYKDITFIVGDIEKGLAFKNGDFDLVYSAFVLEHLQKPEKFLREAIRLTRENGKLVLVAPNFGAPNRASPCFRGSRLKKLLVGFLEDFSTRKGLNWLTVTPRVEEEYQIDLDTTVEPYLLTLKTFLESSGVETLKFSSLWSREEGDAKLHQRLFRLLGEMNVYPFGFWGPHLFYLGEKK